MSINLRTFHVWLTHSDVEAELVVKVVDQVKDVLVFGGDGVGAADSEGFLVLCESGFVVVEVCVDGTHQLVDLSDLVRVLPILFLS